MDQQVGTVEKQGKGLQVIEVGEPWYLYQEGINEDYVLEPLVIGALSRSVNLGLVFLQEHHLKMTCTKEEVGLMPILDRFTSRVKLVDGGCHSFISRRSGEVL